MIDELYEYQLEDVEKSLTQVAILNGSDMGTGKTHTAIATILKWREQVLVETGALLPVLIVAPLNTFESWQEKLAKQAPNLKVHVIDRKFRLVMVNAILDFEADVFLMHWEAVRLVEPLFAKYGIEFSIVIGDEIHAISNQEAKVTTHLKKIKAYRKLAMSGTPSGSNPMNIWSVLNWLYPVNYSSYWAFFRKYARVAFDADNSYKKVIGLQNINVFHHTIEPFYIRHLKKSKCCEQHPNGVSPFLPDKVYERLYVDLTDEQRKIYDQMMKAMVAWVGAQEDTPLIAKTAMTKLLRLMQITLATPVITTTRIQLEDGDYEEKTEIDLIEPSTKMDAVVDLISQDDKSYVVMTSSKKGAKLFYERLQREGISAGLHTGDIAQHTRTEVRNNFRQQKFRILVTTIQTIGTGTDGLQEVCDTIIFLDRTLSVVKNKQAEDRLHRIGQHDTVTIIDVIARDTINLERLNILNGTWNSIREFLGL